MSEYTTIDLCAGIGGLRRGFELTGGFKNILSAEIDPDACKTYAKVFGETIEEVNNDLTSPQLKDKASQLGFDVLLAGFPCQTFSIAGKRQGFADSTKGTIFFHIQEIISKAKEKPKAILLENVANLLSHDGGKTIDTIFHILDEELNYQVVGLTGDKSVALTGEERYLFDRKSFVRNTRNFGIPQNRPRTFIMAFSRDRYSEQQLDFLRKIATPDRLSVSSRPLYNTLGELLESDPDEIDDSLYLSEKYWKGLNKHLKDQRAAHRGFGYKIVYDFTCPEKYADVVASTILATGGSGKERNLVRQPKPGIEGKKLNGKKGVLNSDGIRVMSPTEWGRLQGFLGYGFLGGKTGQTELFPTYMSIGISKGQMYKQFGNSVSIPVIHELADFMLKTLQKLDVQSSDCGEVRSI